MTKVMEMLQVARIRIRIRWRGGWGKVLVVLVAT